MDSTMTNRKPGLPGTIRIKIDGVEHVLRGQVMINTPSPIETPCQMLEALTAFRDRWVGKRISPSTRDEMLAEYDSIRARAVPDAFLALEAQNLVTGIAVTYDEADDLYHVTLSRPAD